MPARVVSPSALSTKRKSDVVCINHHDPDQTIITEEGRMVCLACRRQYKARTRIQGTRFPNRKVTRTNERKH